jgi:hypothetical protein
MGSSFYKAVIVIMLIKNITFLFTKWKLLSFNYKRIIALFTPYISPFIACIYIRSLLNLLFSLTIALINNPPFNLIKLF